MKKIILNNKSNLSFDEVQEYKKFFNTTKYKELEIIYFPSIQYLSLFANSKILIGSQNFYSYNYGNYTGEISLESLKSMNINYTLVGHPDRKKLHLDSYELIKEKLFKSLGSNFKTILCVGTYKEHKDIFKYIKKELNYLLKGIKEKDLNNLSIAYEPIWAIDSDNAEDIEEVNVIIHQIKNYFNKKYKINIETYYGGSINTQNIKEYLNVCDGVLIGKVSNNISELKKILETVKK